MFNKFLRISLPSSPLPSSSNNLFIAFTKFCFWFIYAAVVNELINSGRKVIDEMVERGGGDCHEKLLKSNSHASAFTISTILIILQHMTNLLVAIENV